jgi:hypothetical protein
MRVISVTSRERVTASIARSVPVSVAVSGITFDAAPVQLGADAEEIVPLAAHPIPKALDIHEDRSILTAGEIEILVAAQQVGEPLGGEQGLPGVEVAALVDLGEPPLEYRTALGEVVLREDQFGAGAVELTGEAADLAIDLADEPTGGVPLTLEIVDLVVDVVHLAAQPLLLLPQPLALRADLLQTPPRGFQSCLGAVLRPHDGRCGAQERRKHQHGSPQHCPAAHTSCR